VFSDRLLDAIECDWRCLDFSGKPNVWQMVGLGGMNVTGPLRSQMNSAETSL
jgi:hypothetical protein